MANLPGATPLQNALSSLGALPESQRAGLTKNAFDGIARETSVPANVLIALDEASGGRGDVDGARKTAQAISDLVRGGRSIEDAITTVTGDANRGRAVLDRSYDIADALYPAPASSPAPQQSGGGVMGTAKDVGKTLAGAALSGVGMAVDAAGTLGDEAARALIKSNEIRAGRDPGAIQGTTPIRDLGRWLGNDVIGGAGQAVSDSASPEFRQAMADSSFKGDITQPSTWELPKNPSVAGTIGVGAQVAGTLIPVLLSGSARGAALIGGLMGGGEGVQNGRQFVLDAAQTMDESGRPAIEKLPGYQELIGKGATPEQATAELVRRAETDAGFREGLISSVGGAVTNRIFHTAEGWLGTGGRLARAAKKAGAGFTEEGSQEVAENAASQSGINAATGAQTNIFDDSLQNFIAGGMGGGMAGAVGGAAGRQPPRQQPAPPAPEPMGALPPPPLALPAPTGPGYRPNFTMVDPRTDYVPNFTMRDPEPERAPAGPGLTGPEARLALPPPNPGAVGSGDQVVAAPGQADLSAAGPGAAMPTGPIDAIAKSMTAAMPPTEPASVQRFPDQKPGGAIRLGDPDTGEIVDGVFLRETPRGALVRISGREIELTPQEFDAYRDTAPAIDEARKQAADAAKTETKRQSKEKTPDVEARSPDQPAAPVDRPVSNPVSDDVVAGGEGTAPPRPVVPQGETGVPAVDEAGVSAQQQDQADGRGDAGRVVVADGTRQPEASVSPEERAAALRREASQIRKAAKVPSSRTREERRAEMQRADEMVRQAAAIEDSLKQPPAGVPSPRRAEWLRKRLAFLETQAKASGWDARLLAQRQEAQRELDSLGAKNASSGEQPQAPTTENATHTDPGEVPTPATVSVIESSVQTAVNNTKTTPAEMRRTLLSQIDDAIKAAPKADAAIAVGENRTSRGKTEFTASKGTLGDYGYISVTVRNVTDNRWGVFSSDSATPNRPIHSFDADGPAAARKLTSSIMERAILDGGRTKIGDAQTVSFDVPGDGKFDVVNTPQNLLDFKSRVEKSAGFKRSKPLHGRADDKSPATESSASEIEVAANEAATSPQNDLPEPTQAQKEAGNYKVGRVRVGGMDISIENPKGSERKGVDSDGEPWSVTMPAHYGYVRRTEGADGDHVDVYIGDNPESDKVFVVDQVDAKTGKFDEHKAILGANSLEEATRLYDAGFSDGKGPQRRGAVTEMSVSEFRDWVEKGDTKAPIGDIQTENAVIRADNPGKTTDENKKKTSKINDFGEKLEGARKDAWQALRDLMNGSDDVDIAAEPLSVSWPQPDYEKLIEDGANPTAVAAIRVLRDIIPTKPQASWKLKAWAEMVATLRQAAGSVIDGRFPAERLMDDEFVSDALSRSRYAGNVANLIKLYLAVGHSKSLKGITVVSATYSVFDGKRQDPPLSRYEVRLAAKSTAWSNMPKVLAAGKTREEAISAFKDAYAKLDEQKTKASKAAKLLVYSRDNRRTWIVGFKIGGNHIDLRTAPTAAEARRMIAEEGEALQNELKNRRDLPNERKTENSPRVGADHRSGADVTPEQFAETFGFRGVQFGNWVEGDRRQQDLNEAYDALLDLAGIIDLPAKALSLNGRLGLAFGARGKGGTKAAKAHYEPERVVINLTKRAGAGSLAHEWFHAMDNYFARQAGRRSNAFVTDIDAPPALRPEVAAAFQQVRRAIESTDLANRSKQLDALRSTPYWSTPVEYHARAFESYVIAKLQDQNASNDYLANIVNPDAWDIIAEVKGLGDSYPYLKPSEVDVVRPAFDTLFSAIETRSTDAGVEMYQRVPITNSPVVADITGSELGSWADIRQLGRKAAAWYRRTFLGDKSAPVVNANTGWTIEFNKAGAGKIGGRKGEDIYKAVVALPQILERGVLVNSEPDKRGRPDIKAIHKIAATVRIDGRDVPLVATVRETADGKFHYDLSRENEGGRIKSAEPLGNSRLGQPALEGASSDINIDLAEDTANIGQNDNSGTDPFPDIGAMSSAERRKWAMSGSGKAINAALKEALDRVGISSRVGVALHPRTSLGAYGNYRAGWINIFRQGNSWRRTLDHEIIHALRDPYLWKGEYGLFTANEWRSLVRAGRRNEAIRTWVEQHYPNSDETDKSEEMVAELYSLWAAGKYASPPPGPLARALERIAQFLRAVASALRGEGFVDPASIFEGIADGSVGRRQQGTGEPQFSPEIVKMAKDYLIERGVSADPDEDYRYANNDDYVRLAEMHGFQSVSAMLETLPKDRRGGPNFGEMLQSGKGRTLGMIGNLNWAKTGKVFENWLTDAMGKHDTVNILSLVPGYSLFSELGKNLPGAQTYLRLKQQMDADRNELQAKAADIVDKWVGVARRDTKANDALMDLMHESTLAGIDPTAPEGWRRLDDIGATEVGPRASKAERDRAAKVAADIEARKKTWDSLKARYDALPKRMQQLYVEIRDEYTRMSDLVDAALMENIRTAASIAVKQAKRAHRAELKRIEDEGLTGQERADAIGKANERLSQAMARNAESKMNKISSLRKMFESNKLLGPYFPLARFGSYFATVRDADGKVVSFSRFETKSAQDEFIRRAEAEKLGTVEHGVLGEGANLKAMVDPRFVSEVEVLLQDAGADVALQDAIWQRWLETLPDQSMRKARIHRKGRIGFDRDAIRAFSSAMFHGAHQLARLRYGLEMGEALNDAEEQAADAADPERAGFVVREMRKRHGFTMSPTNNPLVTAASNLAFVWYLGASPATALVNVSQTTIVGVPVLAARFKKLGIGGAVRHLGRALRDFGTGRGSVVKRVNGVPVWTDTWSVENSPRLNADEKLAMVEGYKRGVIDKTQSHDLASVAETGVEYNPTRERVMRAISFMFHHTERLNREVTYLAAYRMARAEGMPHREAVDEASGLTWKTHFSYQNTDRPRIMQSDVGKILTTFRNFTANMLFRLFRDVHQTFKGATKEERAEARAQLIGITLSLFAHAGIRGVWGYGMLMTLLGLFLPGGADDQDEWLQDALLMNGDSAGVAAWNWIMGMALNGVPGTAIGIDLTNRIGMPDLWFRTPDKDLEGKDLWSFYTEQILGPVAAIGGGALTGLSMAADGQVLRGMEKIVPNMASDLLKAGRYVNEGVTTYYGDHIIEHTNPWEVLMTAAGFTPGRIAERYEINNRLKRREKEITDERKDIHREIGDALRAGDPVPESAMEKVRRFNTEYPEYPITAKSIRQSVRSREQSSARNEFGVSLNPKLNARLRNERAPTVYPSNRSTPAREMAEEGAS